MFGSLMYFSQNSIFDNYFIYFVGAYGLGIMAFLAEDSSHPETRNKSRVILLLFLLLILSDTFFELRIKNIIEIVLAVLLSLFGKQVYTSKNITWSYLCIWFSQRAYCAFLIHFSLLLLGNAMYNFLNLDSPLLGVIFMLGIWLLSWLFAHILYIVVEIPSRKIQLR
jgi:hypothetical protein